jgi:hypothetical protein
MRALAFLLVSRKCEPEPSEVSISVSDPVEDVPWNASQIDAWRDRRWSIDIVNLASVTIFRCKVTEARVVDKHGQVISNSGHSFRLRSERYSSEPHHRRERFFSLRSGARVGIDVCAAIGHGKASGVVMARAMPSTEGIEEAIPLDAFPRWLTVLVSAEGLRHPVEKTFKIYIATDGQLRMETVTASPVLIVAEATPKHASADETAFVRPAREVRGATQCNPSPL